MKMYDIKKYFQSDDRFKIESNDTEILLKMSQIIRVDLLENASSLNSNKSQWLNIINNILLERILSNNR